MDDFVTMTQAAEIMGVSRWTISRLVKDGKLQSYTSAIRRNAKLVKRADLERLMTPRPIEGESKKAAA